MFQLVSRLLHHPILHFSVCHLGYVAIGQAIFSVEGQISPLRQAPNLPRATIGSIYCDSCIRLVSYLYNVLLSLCQFPAYFTPVSGFDITIYHIFRQFTPTRSHNICAIAVLVIYSMTIFIMLSPNHTFLIM